MNASSNASATTRNAPSNIQIFNLTPTPQYSSVFRANNNISSHQNQVQVKNNKGNAFAEDPMEDSTNNTLHQPQMMASPAITVNTNSTTHSKHNLTHTPNGISQLNITKPQTNTLNASNKTKIITKFKSEENETFECKLCQKSFKKRCHLTTHSSMHTQKELCKCAICNKTFTQKHRYLFNTLSLCL